jgi:dynein light intermediate chain 1, cytosolic
MVRVRQKGDLSGLLHNSSVTDLTRLGVWVLDGDPGHTNLLKYALNETNYAHTLVILTVSMTTPWCWLDQLQQWVKILDEHLDKLKLEQEVKETARQRLVSAWQNYCETGGDDIDPNSPIKRTNRLSSADDELELPLPEGVLTTNMGLDLVVVVTKVRGDLKSTKERNY